MTGKPLFAIKSLYLELRAKNVTTLAASVSFFGFLSLFPFFVLLVSVSSFFLDRITVFREIDRILSLFPAGPSETVTSVLQGAFAQGRVVSVLSFLSLLYASFGVFGQLQSALNGVMGSKRRVGSWAATLKSFSFFLVAVLFLTLLILGGSAFFVFSSRLERLSLAGSFVLVETVTLAVATFLISFSYRFLAHSKIPWRKVLRGGLVAAVSWDILKVLFGWYISSIRTASAIYGSLGSIFLLMMWLYYSVFVYLAGAHISARIR